MDSKNNYNYNCTNFYFINMKLLEFTDFVKNYILKNDTMN